MTINTVTILGANGAMGQNISGIFASLGDAKVYMVSRKLEDAQAAKKHIIEDYNDQDIGDNLIPETYKELEGCLSESDLVFETVSEDYGIKKQVIALISKHTGNDVLICTGTSGIPINKLCADLSEEEKARFIGVHFYNPPSILKLCELIPSETVNKKLLKRIKKYLSDVLGRTVVQVHDAPAFIGNRIGFQFINEALQLAEKHKAKGGIDYIDAIFGKFTGRIMPPLVTSDLVGLDVHKAIADNVYRNTNDYARKTFEMPEFAEKLISENRLGRKTGEGLYRRITDKNGNHVIQVYDINSNSYRSRREYNFEFAEKMKNYIAAGEHEKAWESLISDKTEEARLCTEVIIRYALYGIYITKSIGEDIHSSDHVMVNGFRWIPPLGIVDAFNSIGSFMKIAQDSLGDVFLAEIKADELLGNVENSIYDYKTFLKAK